MSDDFDFDGSYEAADPNSHRWKESLAKTGAGTPRKNLHNACVALRGHPDLAGALAYDEFSGCTVVRSSVPWDQRGNRPWTEIDDIKATEWLQSATVGLQIGSGIVREAVQAVAYERRFHPVLEYLESLKWDGMERLSGWLTNYMGVPKSPLADAIGRKFLISASARVMRPGCKVDHMLILEGLQGTWKSKSLRTLVGDDWFTDQISDLGTKDSCQDLRGVWIVELSELSAIRPGEVERVKAYISRQVDHYRPSYGRRSIDVPRQCVFIGTTNDTEYLSDPTGGRRFWPVACTNIDVEALAQDRDQIWAEAVTAYHSGEAWWLDDAGLRQAAQAEQELRRVEDPWEAIISAWLDEPRKQPDRDGYRAAFELEEECVTVAQILEHAIAKPSERQTKSDQMRVGKALRLLGWEKGRTKASRFWQSTMTTSNETVTTSNETVTTPEAVTTSNEAKEASEHSTAPKGGHPAEVVTQGGHLENGGHSVVRDRVTTVTTSSAHVRVTPCSSNVQNPVRGGHGGHPAGGSASRKRIGACAYCHDAAYRDDAAPLTSGGVLHYRCTQLWLESQPK